MPLQNRVKPDATIVATPARGTMMGNRGGCFHRADQTLNRRQWASRQWICCVLAFKERRRRVMSPGLYTELFFLDEATALAAGHRPCFECRRPEAVRFAELWNAVCSRPDRARADAMDATLHSERLLPGGGKRCWQQAAATLPDMTLVRHPSGAAIVLDGHLRPWSFEGYGRPERLDRSAVLDVLTPPSIVRILAAGYRAGLHPTALT